MNGTAERTGHEMSDQDELDLGGAVMTTVTCSCCGEVPEQGVVHLLSHRDVAICYPCLDWLNSQRARQLAAIGGGAAVTGHEPAFSVADVARAVDHYQRLGFRTSYHNESYAFAHRDGLTIHLACADDPATGGGSVLYIHVDDADQLASEWRKAGVEVSGPEDYDYGKREGFHIDPDGNKLRFGSPLRHPEN
jgi:catechol 2,3-dioxygenase-like lactoylglutathione lyase family enzyme